MRETVILMPQMQARPPIIVGIEGDAVAVGRGKDFSVQGAERGLGGGVYCADWDQAEGKSDRPGDVLV